VRRLAELQAAFQGYLLRGDEAVAQRLGGVSRGHARERLSIYFDAYRSRLVEALAADFEGLAAALGADGFDRTCRAYVEHTPSRSRNVRWYGGGLAAFLAATAPWSAQPWLADLAAFEWALTLAFDAPDQPAMTFDQLATLPSHAWGSLALELHPSVQLIPLRSNAPALRQAADAGQALPAPAWDEAPSSWIVWRQAGSVHFLRVAAAEGWALHAVREGVDFPGLCDGLCAWSSAEQAPARAAALLRSWVNREMIGAARWTDQ
jgi:hypothetical protein